MENVKAMIHLNKQPVAFNIHPKQTKQHSKYQQQPWRSNKNPKTNNKPAAFIPESVDVLFSFQRSPNTSLKYLFSPSNGNSLEKYLPSQKISPPNCLQNLLYTCQPLVCSLILPSDAIETRRESTRGCSQLRHLAKRVAKYA